MTAYNRWNLCVAFFHGAKAEDSDRIAQLEQAVHALSHSVISVKTKAEWNKSDFTRAPISSLFYSHSVNGDDHADALEILAGQRQGRPIMLATLCEEMKRAAVNAGIESVIDSPCQIAAQIHRLSRDFDR